MADGTDEPIEELDVQAELERLEREIAGEPEPTPEPEPAPEPTPEPAPAATDDVDLKEAALSVFMRMSPEEKVEYAKKLGLETVDKKTNDQEKQEIARGAAKVTAQEMIQAIRSQVPPDQLPDGFDDEDEANQALILMDIRAKQEAKAIVDQELAGFREQERKNQVSQLLDKTSQDWSAELGAPGAAQDLRAYFNEFTEEEIAFYGHQMQNGGGKFVQTVQDGAKAVVEKWKASQVESLPEVDPPKAEPTGGKETYGSDLNDDVKGLMEYMKGRGFQDSDMEALKTVKL